MSWKSPQPLAFSGNPRIIYGRQRRYEHFGQEACTGTLASSCIGSKSSGCDKNYVCSTTLCSNCVDDPSTLSSCISAVSQNGSACGPETDGQLPDAEWTLYKDFWYGLDEENWLTTLRDQGWNIENDSKSWKQQQDWSSEKNVAFGPNGLVLSVSEGTSDCCLKGGDETGAGASWDGHDPPCYDQLGCSGQVTSPAWFKPGDYIEIKAKIPKAHGLWPALWLVGDTSTTWPYNGEIDILEHGGWMNSNDNCGFKYDDDCYFSTVHCQCDDLNEDGQSEYKCSSGNGIHIKWEIGNGDDNLNLEDANIYGCYWSQDAKKIYMFLNGEYQGCDTDCTVNPCDGGWGSPMSAVFNIAIGGYLGGLYETEWTGVYDEEWANHTMTIEYARIWTNTGTD